MTMVLPEPVAILAQSRVNAPPSDGMSMPTFSAAGASVSQISVSMASSWQKKNRRCSRLFGIVPVLEQALGDAGHPRIARLAPGLHPRANLVDQRDLNEDARVVESLGALRRDDIPCRPPCLRSSRKVRALAIVAPVAADGSSYGELMIRWSMVVLPRHSTLDDSSDSRCRGHRRSSPRHAGACPARKGSDTVPR